MRKGETNICLAPELACFTDAVMYSIDGFLRGGLVVAPGRLDDQAHADGLGRDLDPTDLAVDDRANLLDVGLELTLADAGDVLTHTAVLLGFTPPCNAVARLRTASRKVAYSRHHSSPLNQGR